MPARRPLHEYEHVRWLRLVLRKLDPQISQMCSYVVTGIRLSIEGLQTWEAPVT